MKTSSSEFDVLKSTQFCNNSTCKLYQQTDAGNIKTHCRTQGQVYCNCCKGSPFVVTKGTIFYGLKTPIKKVVSTLQLLARGMGVNNTCAHEGVTADSINSWIKKAGNHVEAFTDFMTKDMELDQVQIDEFWSFIQKKRALDAQRRNGTGIKPIRN